MRRWRMLPRFRSEMDLRERGRALLFVEELEGREVLAPIVTAPTFINPSQVIEGGSRLYSGDPGMGGESFSLVTQENPSVDATLSTPLGLIFVDEMLASSFEVTVVGNGTPNVNLVGASSSVNALIQSGFTFVGAPFYSGDAPIDLLVQDTSTSLIGTASFTLQVLPDVVPAVLDWDAATELRLGDEPFLFPPGFLTIFPGFDIDGSETLSLTLSLVANDLPVTEDFDLLGDSIAVTITPSGPGQWTLTGTDSFAFQALFDSLRLVPPVGFSGQVSLIADGTITDTAFFPSDGTSVSASFTFPSASVDLRFFTDALISAPPVISLSGTGAVDLGGRYEMADPAALSGDMHTLDISVPVGALSFNPALVPVGLSVSTSANGISLSGELADINLFLSEPGSVLYTLADRLFVGTVPITFALQNEPPVFGAGQFEAGAAVRDYPPPTVAVSALRFDPSAPAPGTPSPAPGDPGTPSSPVSPGVSDGPANPGRPPGPGAPPPNPGAPRPVTQTTTAFGAPAPPGPPAPAGPDGPADSGPSGPEGGGPGRPGGLDDPDGREGGGPGGPGSPGGSRPVFLGYTGGGPRGPEGPAGHEGPRGAPVPPAHNQPFTRTDALPLYVGEGAKHTLPPVLPVDQTRSVAGFSESAGDSLGLVDMIYREAGASKRQVLVTLLGSAPTANQNQATNASAITARPTAPESGTSAEPGGETTVPVEPAVADSSAENYAYAATAALASAVGWLSRRYVVALFRSALRLFRQPHRQPTQGSA